MDARSTSDRPAIAAGFVRLYGCTFYVSFIESYGPIFGGRSVFCILFAERPTGHACMRRARKAAATNGQVVWPARAPTQDPARPGLHGAGRYARQAAPARNVTPNIGASALPRDVCLTPC